MSTSCKACESLVEATLKILFAGGATYSCALAALEIGGACIAAGGGPEDPVADAVCPAIAVAFAAVCEDVGIEWMKENIPEASTKICKEMKIC
jgi:hypothetical protein